MAEQTVIHEEETDIVVKRQNFDNAMQTIKVFADGAKNPEKIGWQKETGFLGIKKTAKAEDLNYVISKVNNFRSDVQDFNLGVLNIITDVYNALDALDREHIAAILIAANAAKRASQEATKNVENIDLVVKVLKQFKEDLDKLKHLTDVDKAWELLEGQDKLLKSLKDELSKIKHLRDVDKLWDDKQEQAKALEQITKIIDGINKALEIQSREISSITEAISGISNQQNAFIEATNRMLSEKMSAIDQSIDAREKAMQKSFLLLSEDHKKKQEALDHKLSEFFTAQKDAIATLRKEQAEGVANLERTQSERLDRIYTEQADTLSRISKSQDASLKEIEAAQVAHLEQIEQDQATALSTMATEQTNSLAAINRALEDEKAILSSKVTELTQKVKTAYIVAGCAAGVTLIHLILNFLGVI